MKVENYDIFEKVRENRDGGGLALGCVKELKPVWIRDGGESVEALSVDIFVKKNENPLLHCLWMSRE